MVGKSRQCGLEVLCLQPGIDSNKCKLFLRFYSLFTQFKAIVRKYWVNLCTRCVKMCLYPSSPPKAPSDWFTKELNSQWLGRRSKAGPLGRDRNSEKQTSKGDSPARSIRCQTQGTEEVMSHVADHGLMQMG